MKAVLIDIVSEVNDIKVVDIEEPKLKSYYKHLQCDLIDIVGEVEIGPRMKRYDLIVDDEGLLKENPKMSAICMNNSDMSLFGNVLVTKHNGKGEQITLDERDIQDVLQWAKMVGTKEDGLRPLLFFNL